LKNRQLLIYLSFSEKSSSVVDVTANLLQIYSDQCNTNLGNIIHQRRRQREQSIGDWTIRKCFASWRKLQGCWHEAGAQPWRTPATYWRSWRV